MKSYTLNYPKISIFLIILFSMVTMIAGIKNAKSINDNSEYKKTHETEYNLATYTSIICGISIIVFLLISIWSFLYKANLNIVLGIW